MQKVVVGKFGKKDVDAVADDRNWIARIQNELNCTAAWQKDWGFLAAGAQELKMEDATKLYDIDEQIEKIQEQVEQLDIRGLYSTTSKNYGNGQNLESFQIKGNNKVRNKELKACDRKLPKNWKKGKQIKVVNDYDDNFGKKKK